MGQEEITVKRNECLLFQACFICVHQKHEYRNEKQSSYPISHRKACLKWTEFECYSQTQMIGTIRTFQSHIYTIHSTFIHSCICKKSSDWKINSYEVSFVNESQQSNSDAQERRAWSDSQLFIILGNHINERWNTTFFPYQTNKWNEAKWKSFHSKFSLKPLVESLILNYNKLLLKP